MKRKTSLERSFDTVSFRDSLRMRTTSKKIKLSLTGFSKIQVYITVEYLKMTARSKSNSSGAELGHLVKVSKIPFRYIPGFLKTGLVKNSCFLQQKAQNPALSSTSALFPIKLHFEQVCATFQLFLGPLDLKCCQQRENLHVLHLEMSFKLLNLRHAQKSKFRDSFWVRNHPTSLGVSFLLHLFFFCLSFSRYKLLQKVKKDCRHEKKDFFRAQLRYCVLQRQPQNENNLKKDKTLVDRVFKNPGIYHCRISENDCEKQEQQFWSRIGPSGESF